MVNERYSKKLLDHFLHPQNVGEIPQANGVGAAGDPDCGDYMKVWLKIEAERIVDIKFKCKGCPAAIACGSVMTELVRGSDLDEAAAVTEDTILQALGDLSKEKQHCSLLGAAALHSAIMDYVVRGIDGGRPNVV